MSAQTALAVSGAMPHAPSVMWCWMGLEVTFYGPHRSVLSVLLTVTPACIGMPSGLARTASHSGFPLAHDP